MLHGIHWIRPIATLLILYTHCGSFFAQYTSGVGVLMVLSVALSAASSRPLSSFISRRFSRLIVPWLIWCCIYSVIVLVCGHNPIEWLNWPTTFVGPYGHLWFLPCAFVANIVGYVAWKHIFVFMHPIFSVLILLFISCLLVLLVLPLSPGLFFVHFTQMSLAMCLGVLLVSAIAKNRHTLFFLAGMIALCVVFDSRESMIHMRTTYLWTGLLLCVLGIVVKFYPSMQPPKWWRHLSEASYGVYLLHPAAQVAINRVFKALGIYYPDKRAGLIFVLVVIVSFTAVIAWNHKDRLWASMLKLVEQWKLRFRLA